MRDSVLILLFINLLILDILRKDVMIWRNLPVLAANLIASTGVFNARAWSGRNSF